MERLFEISLKLSRIAIQARKTIDYVKGIVPEGTTVETKVNTELSKRYVEIVFTFKTAIIADIFKERIVTYGKANGFVQYQNLANQVIISKDF